MAQLLRVPKLRFPAEIVLPGSAPLPFQLYLAECAARHSGAERPSDLLNGDESFLPAADEHGEIQFLHRDTLMVVTVEAALEADADPGICAALASSEANSMRVLVTLDDGSSLRGTIRFLMPEGRRRLQDFLNLPERFLRLEDGSLIHLVNKRRVVRLAPV